jgi:hypothetical protein
MCKNLILNMKFLLFFNTVHSEQSEESRLLINENIDSSLRFRVTNLRDLAKKSRMKKSNYPNFFIEGKRILCAGVFNFIAKLRFFECQEY